MALQRCDTSTKVEVEEYVGCIQMILERQIARLRAEHSRVFETRNQAYRK